MTEQVNKQKNDLISLTLKTLLYTVWVVVFLAALFVVVFPFKTISFYDGLGLNKRALVSAESYVARNERKYISEQPAYDSKFADALLYCVNTSISLMDGAKSAKQQEKYAVKADKYIGAYLRYGELEKRTALIDEYNLRNTPASFRPAMYSFECLVKAKQIKAQVLSVKTAQAESFIKGEIAKAKLTDPQNPQYSLDDCVDSVILLSCLASYLDAGQTAILTDSVYEDLKTTLEKSRNYIVNQAAVCSDADYLKMLYCFKSVSSAVLSVQSAFVSLGDTENAWEINALYVMTKAETAAISGSSIEDAVEKGMGDCYLFILLKNYSAILMK